MIEDDEPKLVTSGKSKRVVVDGYPFSIDIYRLETKTTWALEVVDHEGNSHVWEEQFTSDAEAETPRSMRSKPKAHLPSCAATTSPHSVNGKRSWPQNIAYGYSA